MNLTIHTEKSNNRNKKKCCTCSTCMMSQGVKKFLTQTPTNNLSTGSSVHMS